MELSITSIELILVVAPLVALIATLCAIEIRTGLIPNAIIFPAAIYFPLVGMSIGHLPWWHYPLGVLPPFLIFFGLDQIYRKKVGAEGIGAGAIKLVAVAGAAIGLKAALEFSAACLIVGAAAGLASARWYRRTNIPVTPIILIALILALGFNFRADIFAFQ